MALVGVIAGTAFIVSAQSATTAANAPAVVTNPSNVGTPSAVDKPESPNDPADTDTGSKMHRHAPLGGDGVVSSITGTTIVFGEESDEGGASYTVDASHATVTNNGAPAGLSDIKVGEKIFVQGAVNGTNVTATSISLGHRGEHADKVGDKDGNATNEASEPTSSSDASDQ